MSMIEDGTGTGSRARVTTTNQLATRAEMRPAIQTLNVDGSVWIVPIDAVAPSGATKFLHILNTGTTPLSISSIRMSSSVAGLFRFLKVTGTPAGGTAVVATPCNTTSVVALPGSVQSGTSITGLTDAGLLLVTYFLVNTLITIDLSERWYVGPNTAVAIQAPAAATVNGGIVVYSDSTEE